MLRKRAHSFHGVQGLLDHRQSGWIGGFYGNAISGFQAVPFALDVVCDAANSPTGLCLNDPATSVEPISRAKRDLPTEAGNVADFRANWRFLG